MFVEFTAILFVGPYAPVDGFVADADDIGLAQGSCDLLGAPLELNEEHDGVPGGRVNSEVAPGSAASPPGSAVGFERAVCAIVLTGVTSEFPADGAGVAFECAGNVGLGNALPVEPA